MGRKSRMKRERRERGVDFKADREARTRVREIERELVRMSDGDYASWSSPDFPVADRQAYLEDILAFESIGSGPSLFEGLEEHGVRLPRPEDLDEEKTLKKLREIFFALSKIGVILNGYDDLSPKEFYSKLWHETLWEGCYIKRKNRASITFIDVSHGRWRSKVLRFLKERCKIGRVH